MDRKKCEQWKGLLAEWAGSGLNRGDFCKAKGVSVWAMDYWKRKLRGNEKGKNTGFVRVKAHQHISRATIRIRLAGQAIVEIEGTVDEEELTKVLRVVKGVV